MIVLSTAVRNAVITTAEQKEWYRCRAVDCVTIYKEAEALITGGCMSHALIFGRHQRPLY